MYKISLVFLVVIGYVAAEAFPNSLSERSITYSSLGLRPVGEGKNERGLRVYYAISDLPATWNQAYSVCRNGGNLVSLSTRAIDQQVADVLLTEDLGTTAVWTSGRFDEAIKSWTWQDPKHDFGFFTNWKNRDPSQDAPTRCISASGILSSYGWNSQLCNEKNYFMCSFD